MVDENGPNEWPRELIPDVDDLFMAVHKQFFAQGALQPGAFRDHGIGMSTDWSKYSTAHECRSRRKVPQDNAVIRLPVGATRRDAKQRVEHAPLDRNRSHTEVVGKKDAEARIRLRRLATVVIKLNHE